MEASADGWDVVLRGGRVIDPESGLDAVRDVAVAAGRIAAVGTGLTARACRGDVDVAGQVVTAGFIDLHSHVSDLGGLRLQAMDGVTTALELEAGVTPVAMRTLGGSASTLSSSASRRAASRSASNSFWMSCICDSFWRITS